MLRDLKRGFDTLVVDEAGQCVETETLIPLRHRVSSVILVCSSSLPSSFLSPVLTACLSFMDRLAIQRSCLRLCFCKDLVLACTSGLCSSDCRQHSTRLTASPLSTECILKCGCFPHCTSIRTSSLMLPASPLPSTLARSTRIGCSLPSPSSTSSPRSMAERARHPHPLLPLPLPLRVIPNDKLPQLLLLLPPLHLHLLLDHRHLLLLQWIWIRHRIRTLCAMQRKPSSSFTC